MKDQQNMTRRHCLAATGAVALGLGAHGAPAQQGSSCQTAKSLEKQQN